MENENKKHIPQLKETDIIDEGKIKKTSNPPVEAFCIIGILAALWISAFMSL